MKSRLKKITIFSLVFLFIFSTTLTTAPKKEVKAAEGYSGKIFRHWTRLRTGKSKKAKVLKTLKVGTAVTVYGTSGSWRKVSVAGKTGYVPKQYVYVGTKAPSLTGSTYEKGQTLRTLQHSLWVIHMYMVDRALRMELTVQALSWLYTLSLDIHFHTQREHSHSMEQE